MCQIILMFATLALTILCHRQKIETVSLDHCNSKLLRCIQLYQNFLNLNWFPPFKFGSKNNLKDF